MTKETKLVVAREKKGLVVFFCKKCNRKIVQSYLAQHQMVSHFEELYRVVEFVPQDQMDEFLGVEPKP